MRRAHPGRRLCIGPLLLCLVVGAGAPPMVGADSGQVLRRGNEVEPETLDPHKARGVNTGNILRDLYEGLTGEAPDGTIVPGAAERWTVSDDGRRYTFHLRPEARWSNGDPVTAHDFSAGLRRCVDPRTGAAYAQVLMPIENAARILAGELPPQALGVEAVDPATLVVRLRAPTPYFPAQLAHPSAFPIHHAAVERPDLLSGRRGPIVGNGAYVLEKWATHSHLTLARNPRYWDAGNVAIDRVTYYPTENAASELKRYRAGELDWTGQLPYSELRWLRQNLPHEVQIHPYLGVYFYGFNLTREPFQAQPGLRKALALAVDRDVLTQRITAAGETPALGWIPPGIPGYRGAMPEWAAWPQARRLSEARRLYAEAGYGPGRPLEVEIRYNTHDNNKRIAVAIAFMWKQALGVESRLVNEEWKVFLQSRRFRRHTQVFRGSWIADYPDPYGFLEILRSEQGLNDTGYRNPEFDATLAAAAAEPDAGRRLALLAQAETIVLADLPVLPIYFYVSKKLIKPYVTGWQPNPLDHHYTKHLRVLPH